MKDGLRNKGEASVLVAGSQESLRRHAIQRSRLREEQTRGIRNQAEVRRLPAEHGRGGGWRGKGRRWWQLACSWCSRESNGSSAGGDASGAACARVRCTSAAATSRAALLALRCLPTAAARSCWGSKLASKPVQFRDS